jgi:hypothetical protein
LFLSILYLDLFLQTHKNMKKNTLFRLLFAVLVAGAFGNTHAQTTFFYQNFETTKTAMPAGWSQQLTASAPSNNGWYFNNNMPTANNGLGNYTTPHSYYAFVDDWDYNTTYAGNNDTLYTPSINCTGKSHVFVSYDAMFVINNGYEWASVAASIDGGKTWTSVDTIPYSDLNLVWQDSIIFDISSIAANQPNVKLAFTYFDGEPNGYGQYYQGVCLAIDNVNVFTPLNYDLGATSSTLPYVMQVGKGYNFTGTEFNYGGDSITSMTMNYSVNGGTAQIDNITGITGFNSLTTYSFTHSVTFTPSSAGIYSVKFWANNLNGANVDQHHANDTLVANFLAIDSIQPKQALYELLTGQSCPYCLESAPNIDTVSTKNKAICNVLEYHLNTPGNDFMYSADSAAGDSLGWYPFFYYNAQGTPQGQLDGQLADPDLQNPPPNYTTPTVVNEVNWGSAFKISITSCTYNSTNNTYSLSANVKAYGGFPSGLKAKVALVVDSIYYPTDWNDEIPKSGFQPPIGTTSAGNGGEPDYLYPYALKYTNVVTALLPTASGTSLNAFTTGSSQTVNVSWVKNHPWSYEAKTHPYDSSATTHMVIFIQSDNGISALGVPYQEVLQSASAPVTTIVGIDELKNGIAFNMYPNPSNGNTNIVFDLSQDQNVNVSIYNLLGEQVYSISKEKMEAGHQMITVAGGNLASGMYMVKLTTDNATTTQKLIIQQ